VHEYRVTKYNPEFRDERGLRYLPEDWTMFRQVGESFAGVILTLEEYERVESAYVDTAITFLREAGLSSITVADLENRRGLELSFQNGSNLPLDKVADVIRGMLQEKFWCRLEGQDAFVHIGWDFYMYIGVPCRSIRTEQKAAELGLFVEELRSPYHKEPND
jgi:hypothetical protein